jgi:hypothetical protein
MSGIVIQIISLILGALFLFMSLQFSRKNEHSLAPAVIIIAAIFFFCGLFHIEGLLKTLMLEQVACWVVALVFLVAAFRFLQREKISLAFTVFILAAAFFFCSLSGVQSLLKTGMLSTVTNTLIKYGENTRIFFKLQNVPVPNSIQATEQSHPGLIRGILGLIVGSPYGKEISLGVGNNKNIAFTILGMAKWDTLEYPNNAVFILKYTKMEQETNLFKKVEVKGKDVFFDNEKEVFK